MYATRSALPGILLLAFAALLLIPVPGHSENPAHSYILWYRNYDSGAIRSLLELAFDKTPEYGSYQLVRSNEMAQGRAMMELARKSRRLLDIATVATSLEREEELNAIPVPIDGGLLGLRVCVIEKGNKKRFEGIQSLADLNGQGIVIGQGAHWPDTPILRTAGISVVTHSRYEVLFGMLERGRFDCFARGVSEVLYDLERRDNPNLVVEPRLLIAYPMPSYFFTGPDDHKTAQRIQLGLERAIEDGSFARYLRTWYGRPVQELDLRKRVTINLPNPHLSEESARVGRQALETLRRRLEGTIGQGR